MRDEQWEEDGKMRCADYILRLVNDDVVSANKLTYKKFLNINVVP